MFRVQTRDKRTFADDVAESKSMASRIADDATAGIVPRLCQADTRDPEVGRLDNRTQKVLFSLDMKDDEDTPPPALWWRTSRS
jgi:hypothetical protein